MDKQTVNIDINGVRYDVEAGSSVLEACRSVGVEIPFFCYHPKLQVAGSCRMCLVYIGTPGRDRATGQPLLNEDGSPKIMWMPKPSIACGTKVSENMHVITEGEKVSACRQAVLEFLLLNHPLDCPICDKAGECKLQEYAHAYGNGQSRFVENKNVKPKKREIEGKIMLDAERCIECSRCIRFCREFIGRSIFGFTKRGSKTEISVFEGADNSSNYLLNVVDGCPVGALTEKAFRFKMRTWFLKATDSVSSESSAGANVRVWSRGNKIYRITPRRNDAVNDMFMSDSGRYVFNRYETNRLAGALLDSTPCQTEYAVERAVEIMKLGAVAVVANANMSVEEMFMLKAFADMNGAGVYMASHVADDDAKLVSADRTANMRGAFMTRLIDKYPASTLDGLVSAVESGAVKTVLCFDEDLFTLGFDERLAKKVNIIYCGVLENFTARAAKVAVPLKSEFEREGLWINRQFRVQKFEKAVDAPEKTVGTLELLASFIGGVRGARMESPSAADVRKTIAGELPVLAGCTDVGKEGLVVDGSAYAGIPFPETDALHFKKA